VQVALAACTRYQGVKVMTTTKKNTPSHTAWFVRSVGEKKKEVWTRIGAGWQHSKGSGLNLQLDLIPNAQGRIVVLERKEKPQGEIDTGAA
jgi:hypothetical protein